MGITDNFTTKLYTHFKGVTLPQLNFTHFAFCSKYDPNLATDNLASDNSEFDRVALSTSDITFVGRRLTIGLTIPANKVVCPTSIIISIDPSYTIYALTPATAGAFKLGDRVEIPTTSGYVERKIIAKDNNLNSITLDSSVTGLVGSPVHLKVSQIAILCNANNTPNPSGDLIWRWFTFPFYKDSTATRVLTDQFDLLG